MLVSLHKDLFCKLTQSKKKGKKMGITRRLKRAQTIHNRMICLRCGSHMKYYKEIILINKKTNEKKMEKEVMYCNNCGLVLHRKEEKDEQHNAEQ